MLTRKLLYEICKLRYYVKNAFQVMYELNNPKINWVSEYLDHKALVSGVVISFTAEHPKVMGNLFFILFLFLQGQKLPNALD